MLTDLKNTAHFIKKPRRLEELKKLHIKEQRKRYIIEKTIKLLKYDYENFITDFGADRWFIEENMNLCYIDDMEIWHCIFVKQIGKSSGVLIQLNGSVFIEYAALKD